MNILVVEDIASSRYGGAERTMRALCERLAGEHRIHLVYDRIGDYVTDTPQIYASVRRVSTLPLGVQRPLAWLRALLALVRLCRRERIEVVLTHVSHSAPLLRLLRHLCGVRVCLVFKWIGDTDSVGRQLQWGVRGADTPIAVSHFVARYWANNTIPLSRIEVIPEGVGLAGWGEAAPADTSMTTGEDRPFRIGFAGRIVEFKGLHVLLEAVRILLGQGLRVECRVMGRFDPVGDHPAREYHRRIHHELAAGPLGSAVRFLGFVDPLEDAFADLDLFVMPSLCDEAQSVVLLQAMATGRPVIATAVGGVPEVLSGPLGRWLVSRGSADDLARKIREVIEMAPAERAELGRALRTHVEEHFTLARSHERMLSVLRPGRDGSRGDTPLHGEPQPWR